MNACLSVKDRKRLVLVVALLVGVSLPWPSRAAEGTFSTTVDERLGEFQQKTNGLDPALKDKLEHEINAIQAEAGPLDQLQSQVEEEQGHVNTLEMDYKNAQANADGLRRQCETDHAKINSIGQEEVDICGRLGGALEGNRCIFTCSSSNPAQCKAKIAEGYRQVGPLNSQLQSIQNQLEKEKQQQADAEADADTKKQAWENAQDQLTNDENHLAQNKDKFEQDDKDLKDELDSLPSGTFNPKLGGTAWDDANNVNAHLHCYDYNSGCGMPVEPLRVLIPPVVTRSPAFTKATEILNQALEKGKSARQALREAEHDPATSGQELRQRVQEDSRAQGAIVYARYELRLTFPIDLNPVPPTRAKPQP